jgi:hypothetical protein
VSTAKEKVRGYLIEFRNGSFFRSLDAERSCDEQQARRFSSKEEAEGFMSRHPWILFNGGMVVSR